MTEATKALEGVRVLVVEDDYYLANDLQEMLAAAGATVLGPVPDQRQADRHLGSADCALVDINLGEGPSFALPAELQKRDIPFAFVTGYDAAVIPAQFEDVERCEKPLARGAACAVAARLIQAREAKRTSPA